jgi:hypothetical protein
MEPNPFGGIQKLKKTFALPGQVPTVDTGIITFCENPRCEYGGTHIFNKQHDDGLMCSKCGCTGLTKVRSPYNGHAPTIIYPDPDGPNPNRKEGGNRRKIRKKKTKRKQKKSRKSKKRRTRSRK